MIYIRDHKLYDDINNYLQDYSLFNYRIKAFFRVLKNQLNKKPLIDYPEIDIYLEIKSSKNLGRFTNHPRKFYKRQNQDPYIILYIKEHLKCKNQVKEFIDTIYHEFIHYRQYLENDKVKHTKELHCRGLGNLDEYITILKVKD